MRRFGRPRKVPSISVGVVLLALAGAALAEDRMPPLAPEAMTAAQREAVAALEAARGNGVRGPWIALLRSPEVLNRARAMGDYLRFRSVLPPRLSEFLILLTARDWTQQYEWQAHYQIALDAGVSVATAAAIRIGHRPERMSDEEGALYDLWSEITRYKRVSDATYRAALEHFGEQGVIDALGIVGYYSFLAMIMNTAGTPLPPDVNPPLDSLP
jgi:4-carboxymuconolactone decarboxylase